MPTGSPPPAGEQPNQSFSPASAAAGNSARDGSFRSYASLASEGIWHVAAAPPIPVTLPVDAQVRLIFDTVHLVDCNDAMVQMYGLADHTALTGVSVRDLLIDNHPQNEELLTSFVRSGYRLDGYESVERTPDGARRIFLNSIVGVVRDGMLTEAWGSQRDITDRKHREASARQAQAMDAVSLLSGSVAHEFNNLLTTILSTVELLAEQCPGQDRAMDDAESIRRAARRGGELTRQLLALSQQQVLQARAVDVHALVRNVAGSIRDAFARSVLVDFIYDDASSMVSVDPDELERTLLHLAAYAAQVIGERGSFAIDVRQQRIDEAKLALPDPIAPGSYVTIGIRHSGVPRTSADGTPLLDPFAGGEMPSLGTGLALATMYGFVRQSGGAVVVDPAPAGVSLRMYFPIATPAPAATRPTASAANIASAASVAAPANETEQVKRTLLVVEDDVAVRLLMKRVFERAGFAVLAASHGDEALEVSRRFGSRIDALVTDVIMPGMGGGELTRRLRRERPNLRVLHVSGYTAGTLRQQDIIDAGDAFLQKPFTPQALLARLNDALL